MGCYKFIQLGMIGSAVLGLAGCGIADSRSPVPAFMRAKEADPPPPEPPPNVKQLVHDKLDSVFVSTSYPQNVEVSQPVHDPRGPGWTACVRADVNSATGKPIGTETYRITIKDGEIVDRRRVDDNDNCVTENYQPI
ncbi:hypothetical protein [Bradyrhizobium sp. STM 3562]|uniref:hypothetical protein n=1 Tax=Bradyrhizobium sp. STM 3562 TaxID=578924 RepID=UPI0038903162